MHIDLVSVSQYLKYKYLNYYLKYYTVSGKKVPLYPLYFFACNSAKC